MFNLFVFRGLLFFTIPAHADDLASILNEQNSLYQNTAVETRNLTMEIGQYKTALQKLDQLNDLPASADILEIYKSLINVYRDPMILEFLKSTEADLSLSLIFDSLKRFNAFVGPQKSCSTNGGLFDRMISEIGLFADQYKKSHAENQGPSFSWAKELIENQLLPLIEKDVGAGTINCLRDKLNQASGSINIHPVLGNASLARMFIENDGSDFSEHNREAREMNDRAERESRESHERVDRQTRESHEREINEHSGEIQRMRAEELAREKAENERILKANEVAYSQARNALESSKSEATKSLNALKEQLTFLKKELNLKLLLFKADKFILAHYLVNHPLLTITAHKLNEASAGAILPSEVLLSLSSIGPQFILADFLSAVLFKESLLGRPVNNADKVLMGIGMLLSGSLGEEAIKLEQDFSKLSLSKSGLINFDNYSVKSSGQIAEDGILLRNFENNPLANIEYTQAVQDQMKLGDYHAFPNEVDNWAGLGKKFEATGGDGVVKTKVELTGSYGGKDGHFEWYIEPDGKTVNHRLFVPDRKI